MRHCIRHNKAGQTKFTVYRHNFFDFACGRAGGHYSDFKLLERLAWLYARARDRQSPAH